MRKTYAIIALLIIVLVIAGCKPKVVKEKKVVVEKAKETGVTADVSSGVSDVKSLDEELNTSDLDTLDEDFSDVENLLG